MNLRKHFSKVSYRSLCVWLLLTLLATMALGIGATHAVESPPPLLEDFVVPSDDNVVWCYYYWINDDISRAGVTKDMEAMKEFGIGGVLIGNINPSQTDGRVPLFSEEWWDITIHAVNEGHRLGIEVGFFNCPGWSQSGGPWISHEEAMRYLIHTETRVQGPGSIDVVLEQPMPSLRITGNDPFLPDASEYQDTHVLAFRTVEAETHTLTTANAQIDVEPAVAQPEHWLDGDTETAALFDRAEAGEYRITIRPEEAFTARSLQLHPAYPNFRCEVEIHAEIDGDSQHVRTATFDRSNPRVNVGPQTHAPLAIALPELEADAFTLVMKQFAGGPNTVGFSQITFSEAAVLEEFVEKSLGKMHPTPLPEFDTYLWDTQPELESEDLVIAEVLDLSAQMDAEGRLQWEAPEGDWTILRLGMTPTGTRNAPAAPQGTGYEVDKANAALAKHHFEQFMGEIIRRTPEESLPALKYLIADSYEMGPQNWTDGFAEKFEAKYGYNPVKYLPTLSGRIVGSVEESERFLWDLRRAVADDVAYEYVGGLREIANEHNLELWLENYGHWGFPSEFLMYGGQSDRVAGEYWNEGSLGNIECKAASSAANIYGKPVVSVEAWTASGQAYRRHPAMLKRRGDWSLTEGVNHHVLHVYIHQPDDDRVPGVNAWFSTEFNRHNTWFDQGKVWVDYLRRSQHLLQQPHYAADVCYFIGEDAPKMSGLADPPIPPGYSYDYINAEVILDSLYVEDGRLMLPHGNNYGLMVLPQLDTMRPEVLEKIEALVQAGAAVMGPAPVESPSLQDFPESDARVQEIAARMWPDADAEGQLVHAYGDGYVLDGIDLQAALDLLEIPKDVNLGADVPVLWTHRTSPDREIYFLTNQGDEKITFEPSFRVSGMQPQLWDAVTGEVRLLNEYTETDGHITVPMTMEPLQSWFIVFAEDVDEHVAPGFSENFPEPETVVAIEGDWSVDFLNKDIGPAETLTFSNLEDWTSQDDERIRYYAGAATYQTTFTVEAVPEGGQLFLNLGEVGMLARATLNGEAVGGVWMAPYRIPLGDALREGDNDLEVEVVNTWRNQLIKDAGLPEEERYTWTMVSDAQPDEALQASGLMGPVQIEWKH